MNDTLLQWDGQAKYALYLLGASRQSDMTCEIVARAIADRTVTVARIEEESRPMSEKPAPRANEFNRLQNEIRDFNKLAREKGCPTESFESEPHSES